MRRALAACLGLVLLSATSALGQVPAVGSAALVPEAVEYPSVTTPFYRQLLAGNAGAGKPLPAATIKAQLYVPKEARAPMPVVVIAHGSGGIVPGHESDWAAAFAKIGIASLVFDSFGSRGIAQTVDDQTRLGVQSSAADAFYGLKFLAADPRFDKTRIAVMGFSRGGQVALHTAFDSLRKAMVGELKFAAHFALYPSCATQYRDKATDRSPITILHGEADDYTPLAQCRDYARWFEGAGSPVTLVTYPGAYHDFDHAEVRNVIWAPRVANYAACSAINDFVAGTWSDMDGAPGPVDATAVTAYYKTCWKYGAHLGFDRTAAEDARRRVLASVRQVFALP